MSTNTLEMIVLLQVFFASSSWIMLKLASPYLTREEADKSIEYLFFAWVFLLTVYSFFLTVPLLIISYYQ